MQQILTALFGKPYFKFLVKQGVKQALWSAQLDTIAAKASIALVNDEIAAVKREQASGESKDPLKLERDLERLQLELADQQAALDEAATEGARLGFKLRVLNKF